MNNQAGNQDESFGKDELITPDQIGVLNEKTPTTSDFYEIASQTLSPKEQEAFNDARMIVEKLGTLLRAVLSTNSYIEESATGAFSSMPALKELGAVGDHFYKAAQNLLINIQDAAVSPREYAAREVKLLGASNALHETIGAAIGELESKDAGEGAKLVEILNDLEEEVKKVHTAIQEVVHRVAPEPPLSEGGN